MLGHAWPLLLLRVALASSVSTEPTARVLHNDLRTVLAHEGAFATIFYDYGIDSEDLLLAARVLMRSIKDSKTRYRKIIVVPEDGIRPYSEKLLRSDGDIEIVQADIPNAFRDTVLVDHRAQLLHMRNKLIFWDDTLLSSLKRIAYVDPENVVLQNMDEIFACYDLCAVDNGQSVVYASSLLILSPDNLVVRNLLSDAIDSFMISGRSYGYTGITQGFIPGLFEAFEESPLFYNVGEKVVEITEETKGDMADSRIGPVVHRLPFYYSINHMVYYERLNWDLYRCRSTMGIVAPGNDSRHGASDHGSASIPGPLLSYKYSGSTVKPWYWVPYVYFSVFWHWQRYRARLGEDFAREFNGNMIFVTLVFIIVLYLSTALCVLMHRKTGGRQEITSSRFQRYMRLEFISPRILHGLSRFTCAFINTASSIPRVTCFFLTATIYWISIYSVPSRMHPSYAVMLSVYIQNNLIIICLAYFKIADVLRQNLMQKSPSNGILKLLLVSLSYSFQKMPILIFLQVIFLYFVRETELVKNPVFRPSLMILLFLALLAVEMRLLHKHINHKRCRNTNN